jgi:VWFA-related protein
MIYMRNRLLFLAVIFLCLQVYGQSSSPAAQASPSPSPDQQQPKKIYEPAPVLKVTTRLVTVDVVVVDQHGQPVTGLQAQDFTLIENGKPQQISIFKPHRPPAPGTVSTELKPLKLPANIFSNIPTYNPNNSMNVIVLDLLNTDFNDQSFGRRQVLKYLGSIPDNEPITVAVYSLSRKLQLVQDFTSDFTALRDAIQGMKSEHVQVLDARADGARADDKELADEPHRALRDFSRIYETGQQLDRRVEYTLDGLLSLARRLSGYPGRKNLIWISTTFPIGFGPDVNVRANEFESLRTYEQTLISASEALVDAQIAVYPVDPRGPLSPSMYAGAETLPSNQVVRLTTDSATGAAEQNTMDQVARLTGGKAFYNKNDIGDAIRNIIDDGSTYYTLAYYPDDKNWNGEYRKIAVKIDRSGVKLRHRPGYYALNTNAGRDPRNMYTAFGRALNLDSPISTAFRFETGVVQPSEKTGNKVLLNFALDPHAVIFDKQDDGLQHAAIDCAVQAYNGKHELIKTDANTLSVALDEQGFSKAMQSFLFARVSIDLPAGSYLLRLGVMDEHSGIIGTANAPITVGLHARPAESKQAGKAP